MANSGVIGRGSELGSVGRFLDDDAAPSALILEGEAGIGKTTLWEWAVGKASSDGRRVLRSRAASSEAALSFAALGDLLDPLDADVLGQLPEPQRTSLEVALLRGDSHGSAPDRRAVSLATLATLRILANDGPVLLAVDDVQWLDVSSADVLRFVIRRLADEPISIVATLRTGEANEDPLELARAIPGERFQRIAVGSMSVGDLARLIRERLGGELPRPMIERVHTVADGNPFFAIEVARELVRTGLPEVGEALPIPADMRDLLKARLSALPEPTRTLLLVVSAATPVPTEALVAASSGLGSHTDAALTSAIDAEVVTVDHGQIRFTHPLLASTVYASASPQGRRDAHRRLAEQIEDGEERARHLALASTGPDGEVAAALDDAAEVAGSRGAPQSAAALSELARRLTPTSDVSGSIRRTVEAAAYLFDAGDDAGARARLEEAIASTSGDERARLLYQLASVSWMDMHLVNDLCQRALDQSGDPNVEAAVHDHLSWVGIYRGDLEAASRHAQRAIDRAGTDGDPAIRADIAATFGMVRFLMGEPADAFMAEGRHLHDEAARASAGIHSATFTAAPTCHGLQLLWAGELPAARDVLERQLHAYEDRGQYIVRDEVLGYLAEVECRAGNFDLAERYAAEGYEIDLESGRSSSKGHQLFPKALVAAYQGRVEDARSDAEEGLARCLQDDDRLDASCHRWVLGFLDLSLADPSAALRHLEPSMEYLDALGSPEPGIIPCIPDAVEALTTLGRSDDAGELVDRLDEQGRVMDRPWARAMALRCRGLLLASRGDSARALEELDMALEEHERVPQPFDRARTLLVKGEVERRLKKKAAARASMEQALAAFEELGAPLWSKRVRSELDRIGGRPPSPAHLTGTERQVAELVAEGKTNAEVAGQLFMSVHTVRSNLRRIYGKLGVRHRSELASKLDGTDTPDAPSVDQ